MECVNYCFSQESHRFENVNSIYEVCLVATCNCSTGSVSYSVEEKGNVQVWDLNNFGTDRDLYDKNGLLIYQYNGDELLHRDIDELGNWKDTWHVETNETVHDEAVR